LQLLKAERRVVIPDLADSFRTFGNLCCDRGDIDNAISFHLKAKNIDTAHFGRGHCITATNCSNLANAYSKKGQLSEALRLSLEAVEILKQVSPSDTKLGRFLDNLGTVYVAVGDFQKARNSCEEALSIYHDRFGEKRKSAIDFATCLNHLAACFGVLDSLKWR
jgi:tetratricopeptide (TPR) repeat protein